MTRLARECRTLTGPRRLVNRKSGKALSVLGKSTDEDSYIVQWEYDSDPSQQWILERP